MLLACYVLFFYVFGKRHGTGSCEPCESDVAVDARGPSAWTRLTSAKSAYHDRRYEFYLSIFDARHVTGDTCGITYHVGSHKGSSCTYNSIAGQPNKTKNFEFRFRGSMGASRQRYGSEDRWTPVSRRPGMTRGCGLSLRLLLPFEA